MFAFYECMSYNVYIRLDLGEINMVNLLTMSPEFQSGIKIAIIIVAVLAFLYLLLGLVFFNLALGRKKRKDPTQPAHDSLFERNKTNEHLIAGYKWFDETYHQNVSIKNRKGKNLHAVEFRNPSNSDVWVVCLQGWTNMTREMSAYADEFYKRGFNVLIPELRGHQNSEYSFVTMGWNDRLDVVDWIENIVEEIPKSKIIIMGVSMGGATTMMTTGEKLPENVMLAIEDCGFSGVKDILVDQSKRAYKMPPWLIVPPTNLFNRIFNGFFFGKGSAVEQLKKSVTPTMFIHGDKDDFVLPSNLDVVYKACAAPKARYVVKGAEHALSSHCYHEEYWVAVDKFLSVYLYAEQLDNR